MPKMPYINEHGAQVLAARLRERGLHYSARQVQTWSAKTVRGAKLWLDLRTHRVPFVDFLGVDAPPPPNPAWGRPVSGHEAPVVAESRAAPVPAN